MANKQTGVYRFYAADQTLLYIDVSQLPMHREIARLANSPWMALADISRTTVTWFDTDDGATAHRDHALKTERPVHNRKPARVRKTLDITGDAQEALRKRLHDAAVTLGVPIVAFQHYAEELLLMALEDEGLHQAVIRRLEAKGI
jgi:hypothetical protein